MGILNSLIGQFLTKRSQFEEITGGSVKKVKGLLNRRPQKSLKFAVPTEVFLSKSFGVDVVLRG